MGRRRERCGLRGRGDGRAAAEAAGKVTDDLNGTLPEGAEPRITRYARCLRIHMGSGANEIALLQTRWRAETEV